MRNTLLASLLVAVLAPASALAQQARCDCAATACLPAGPGEASLRGRLVQSEGRDANGRLERYLAVEPSSPVCVELPSQEGATTRPVTSPRLQLVVLDPALRAQLQAGVGREQTLRGVVLEQLTAHHHTPLLLDARAMAEPPRAPAARCQADRVECLREGLPALTRAMAEVPRAPEQARAILGESRAPSARVWAAYLAHHAGDDAAAETALAALARDGETPTLDAAVTAPADRALRLAREHAELLGDDAMARLPCAVFAWDPASAARAFGPMHGSTRDALMAPFKQRCVAEALAGALSSSERARVSTAVDAVTRALFRQWPRPADGTIWTMVAISAREALTDPLLGVEGDPLAAQDAAARAVVERMAQESPASLSRLAAYRSAAEGRVGAIARGICAVWRARGRTISSGECRRRAYTATLSAFTVWVGARQGME
ncbi:MAG: hypothetical protein R3A48_11320 [Polyangiales bacterium]